MRLDNEHDESQLIPINGPDFPTEEGPEGLPEEAGQGAPFCPANSDIAHPEPPDRSSSALAKRTELHARIADLEDRWKRAAADLDNYRKRFDRELQRLRLAERAAICKSWISVVDEMERALCSQGASSSPWYEGMEAIHARMLEVMERFGVRPFVPQGEKFDHHMHEAVATANLADEPEGKIVEVIQTGYLLDGEVLRPAKVVAVKHSA